jgi:hypothetical protein
MSPDSTDKIKKYFLTVLLVSVFSLVLVTAGILTSNHTGAALRRAAQAVLADGKTELGEPVHLDGTGWSFSGTYRVRGTGRADDLVFLVAMTGSAGPMTGVFLYTPATGSSFCGLAGITGNQAHPETYGITPRIINHWENKLDRLVEQAGGRK